MRAAYAKQKINFTWPNYSTEFTPTETSAGGTLLLYIANHLS